MRQLLDRDGLLVAPGAYDGLSARLVERAGFPAIYLTGGGIARSFGRPDNGATTIAEVVDRVASIAAVTTRPLIADLDAGHGGVAMIRRAVPAMAEAGAAAIHLEDREVPRRFRNDADNILSAAEMTGRIRAALDSRPDGDFVVIARTDVAPLLGLDEAIDRANRYADAGADVIYVEHMKTLSEMEAVARRVAAPKLVSLNKGLGDTPPAADLAAMGFKILTLPADLQLAAIHAMQSILAHLDATGTTVGFDAMVAFGARDEIVGLREARDIEGRYLPDGREPTPSLQQLGE
ncbi:isocitrate lyase/PEP mutase family protein [Acuticoccus kandeliae]|uniref:isocitrate lyase/PEP mutase family protein n=1 Tax=Acuticoccus kandeliae TaxID=2073160 RepID=UPI0013006FE1|nr:isocitrate lyase/PEP mutase family protein [Acuticoccus kandeliae]